MEPAAPAHVSRGAAVFTGVCAIATGLCHLFTWPTRAAFVEGAYGEAELANRLLRYAYVCVSLLTAGGLVVGLVSRRLQRAAAAITVAVGLAIPWLVWVVAMALVDPSKYVDPGAIVDLYPTVVPDAFRLSEGVPPQNVVSVALLIAGGLWMTRQRDVSP